MVHVWQTCTIPQPLCTSAFAPRYGTRLHVFDIKLFYKIFLAIVKLNERNVLEGPGKISHELAKQKAETEYNKYKEIEKEQIHIEN